MRVFQYKELFKLFALNFRQPYFADSRISLYAFILLPGTTAIGFNLISPFSIFRRIMIVSAALGTSGSFLFSLKTELHELGKTDETALGD